MTMKAGLEFAPGTTTDCKRLIGSLLKPGEILGLYRDARRKLQTGDLVIIITDEGPVVSTRMECIRNLQKTLGARARELKLCHESAHKVVQLPIEDEAMWVVVDLASVQPPSTTVLYVLPYQIFQDDPKAN